MDPSLPVNDFNNNIQQPLVYQNYQLKQGIAQLVFPNFGVIIVRPTASTVDPYYVCRLNSPGGFEGFSALYYPKAGDQVLFSVIPKTTKGIVISSSPTGKQLQTYTFISFLHNYPWDVTQQKLAWRKQLQQDLEQITKGKQHSTPLGAAQDVFSGDYILCDKKGPQFMLGRLQLTIKGSDLAYTEYSAVSNKITTVANTYQLDTFTSKIIIDTQLNKNLKAATIKQGLGKYQLSDQYPVKLDKYQVTYTDTNPTPVYREQSFNGGLLGGSSYTVMTATEEKSQLYPVMSKFTGYTGLDYTFSADSRLSIKTPTPLGIREITDQQISDHLQKAKEFRDTSKKLPEVTDATQKAIQLQRLSQTSDNGILITTLLEGVDVEELIQNNVSPFTQSLYGGLSWEDGVQKTSQAMAGPSIAKYQNQLTKISNKLFDNTSFISQQPDGSIIIKDGWGSSIIMSRGNIYISSALDTFIRPGRDLINLVPRHCQTTSNQQIVLASKADIKVASQQSVHIASAVSGEQGYITIQNRSKEITTNSGIILRSNANMSITASGDMRIALNDKTKVNADKKASTGKGSIIISGGAVSINSTSNMTITAKDGLGLYAYQSQKGAGINISNTQIAVVGSQIALDTSLVQCGKTDIIHTVKMPAKSQEFILNKGSSQFRLHVRGEVQCKGILSSGDVLGTGQLGGSSYIIFREKSLQTISGSQKRSIETFNKSMKDIFSSELTANIPMELSAKQDWYTDSYICTNELAFCQSSKLKYAGNYRMPTMCWQMSISDDTNNFKPVTVTKTGTDQKTYTYPGKQAWISGTISSIDQNYTVQYVENLTNYKTNAGE